jgi:hypothetical protein
VEFRRAKRLPNARQERNLRRGGDRSPSRAMHSRQKLRPPQKRRQDHDLSRDHDLIACLDRRSEPGSQAPQIDPHSRRSLHWDRDRLSRRDRSEHRSLGIPRKNAAARASSGQDRIDLGYSRGCGSSTISNQYFSRVCRMSTSASNVTGFTM